MNPAEKLKLIEESGVLNIRGGSAVIHFDEQGNIRKIEEEKVLYIDRVGFVNRYPQATTLQT